MLKKVFKVIIELVVFILLILTVIYLIISKDGILAKMSCGNAKEKLDEAIRIFVASDGITLEDVINNIEGLEKLEINKETGEYKIRIEGQQFIVVSQEVMPEDVDE